MRCHRFGLRAHEWGVLIVCAFLAGFIGCMGMSRSPSRRSQCSVQLKNLAHAAIVYENTHGQLPGYVMDFGTFTAGDVPVDPGNPDADTAILVTHRKIGTWAVALLPSLDAQPTYEVWNEDRYPIAFSGGEDVPLSSGESGIGFATPAAPDLPIFHCPSPSH